VRSQRSSSLDVVARRGEARAKSFKWPGVRDAYFNLHSKAVNMDIMRVALLDKCLPCIPISFPAPRIFVTGQAPEMEVVGNSFLLSIWRSYRANIPT
jgi:hypothetical protein